MKKSDDQGICQKMQFHENSENLGSQTVQNVGFLEGLKGKNEEVSLSQSNWSPEHYLDQEFLKSWVMGKSKHTKRAYLKVGEELLSSLHPKSLKEASLSQLQQFVELHAGRSHDTRRQRTAIVKSLFSFGQKTGYLSLNPAAFLPTVKGQSKISERYLTEEEVMKMINLTTDLRDATVLRVLYGAGLRVSELVGLNWEDLQERENGTGQLRILGKGKKERIVIISSATYTSVSSLKQYNSQLHESIFISREKNRLSVGAVQFIIDRARLRGGITKKVSPHWFRHAHASHALDRGASVHLVQSTLGHASVATTGRYLHARPNESSGRYLCI